MERRTFVYYHLPGDFDDAQHPNVFIVSKPPEEIKLKDIVAAFPLPGRYHFRFKHKLDNSDVWLDISNPESLVPFCFGNTSHPKIYTKILRVSWINQDKMKSNSVQENQKKQANLFTDWNGPIKYSNAELINGKEYTASNHTVFPTSATVDSKAEPAKVVLNNPLDTKVEVSVSLKDNITNMDDDIMKMFDQPSKTAGNANSSKKDDFDLIFT